MLHKSIFRALNTLQITKILEVVLDTPLNQRFDYQWIGATIPLVGQIAIVNFANREMAALIVGVKQQTDVPPDKLKQVIAVRNQLTPLSNEWLQLCEFAANYYQRPLGEVALPALPKNCRSLKSIALDKALLKIEAAQDKKDVINPLKKRKSSSKNDQQTALLPTLNEEQLGAVQAIVSATGFAPFLLYGVTGSGKTEVYLHAAAEILAHDSAAQVLLLVPEINLTPQLQSNLQARFPQYSIGILHSGMSEGERTLHWLAAHSGHARLLLGTRLAILASLPNLKLIIIDEEHDPSYKQQEGLRYSARDLAVWRARQLSIPIVLGSATPSIETWQHASAKRYQKLSLTKRAISAAILPTIRVIDTSKDKPQLGLTQSLITALNSRLEKGEQSLIYLNRRGYAPVIACDACGWMSACNNCSAYMVLHKYERKLRCHHCSNEQRIPTACPTCGNADIQPLGRGTQRIEERLQQLFPSARIKRIDADSTRLKGSAEAAFEEVHSGQVDILIGTQMVAKGHDFKNLTLVGVINPDTALFSQDYRASERLFAQLMQVAGRAGRAGQKEGGNESVVIIQTQYPQHPLYQAIKRHDYPSFAKQCLLEREQAGLPPFMYQALLRAEAKELEKALMFLKKTTELALPEGIVVHDPIPMSMVKIANIERAQLLIESQSRPALQAFLKVWLPQIAAIKPRINWSLEVDPIDI